MIRLCRGYVSREYGSRSPQEHSHSRLAQPSLMGRCPDLHPAALVGAIGHITDPTQAAEALRQLLVAHPHLAAQAGHPPAPNNPPT